MRRKQISAEALLALRQQLANLPKRCHERRVLVEEKAELYGVSTATLYRALRNEQRPRAVHRVDRGMPRKLSQVELMRYCEIIAAMKVRTSNKKGRCLSTARAIELLEAYGLNTPEGFVHPRKGLLTKSTVNYYLKALGYGRQHLSRQPPVVRFQAQHSNECWHFDLSPSDLKHLERPSWIEPGRGRPILMLFSVVDDRSGVAYQEYRCVYGEDVEAGLRFLFNAMSPKESAEPCLQGIPKAIYTDNGPIARSRVFQMVMECLGIELMRHMPTGSDGNRVTARAKGKVERPFRTVKEAHETLYHFHKPETETEANRWLHKYLQYYNQQPHRSEESSRIEDWQTHLGKSGLQQMCSWERFCTFAREPEQRKVGADARVTVEGVSYEVEPDLAGETVMLWWGLFDNELFVEHDEQRYGPFLPVDGPIPLHHYRKFKKTKTQKQAEHISTLAKQIQLPRAALGAEPQLNERSINSELPQPTVQPFQDPDPFQEFTYPNILAGKRAISDYLAQPLARLSSEQLTFIDQLLGETLVKKVIQQRIRDYFYPKMGEGFHAH